MSQVVDSETNRTVSSDNGNLRMKRHHGFTLVQSHPVNTMYRTNVHSSIDRDINVPSTKQSSLAGSLNRLGNQLKKQRFQLLNPTDFLLECATKVGISLLPKWQRSEVRAGAELFCASSSFHLMGFSL